MPAISGIGDGAGSSAGGRSGVNAYSDANRTVVAAQVPLCPSANCPRRQLTQPRTQWGPPCGLTHSPASGRPGVAHAVRLGRTALYVRVGRKLRLIDSAEIPFTAGQHAAISP